MRTKMNDPVRLPDGSVSTIGELALQGRITFRRIENFTTRKGTSTRFFADIAPDEGWEISKYAYRQKAEVQP